MKKLSTIQQNSSVEALNPTHLTNTKGGGIFSSMFSFTYVPPMIDELTDKRRPPSKPSSGTIIRP
jgi:hypothetical protein